MITTQREDRCSTKDSFLGENETSSSTGVLAGIYSIATDADFPEAI